MFIKRWDFKLRTHSIYMIKLLCKKCKSNAQCSVNIVCNSPLVHGFLLVVNKVGDQVVEAWFDEIIIVGLISSEAATEARAL